jgi:hypothetical protein
MAAPKATPKAAPKVQRINTPKVNKATGFSTGTVKTNATKSNPRTTMTPAAQKKAAGVQSAKTFTPAATKAPNIIEQAGNFIQSRVDLMTGKTPSPISGAMKNKIPVIPYTQKNVKAAKDAGWQP